MIDISRYILIIQYYVFISNKQRDKQFKSSLKVTQLNQMRNVNDLRNSSLHYFHLRYKYLQTPSAVVL